jgi:hydroxymethylbilane synthase
VPSRHLRIGTRGSPMALHQTALVRDRLVAAHPELAAKGAVEIMTIRTTGDRVQDRLLAEIGGKGLFAKEIEEALIAGHIDLAVHSLKDLETWLPAGVAIACVLPRDDPRDAFLSMKATSLAALPQGERVGTASLRRQAQLLRRRPDLKILPIRGNANTRIRKLHSGEIDALVLALCGLERLGKAELATEILSREIMLPAVGQGALTLECRARASCRHSRSRRACTPRCWRDERETSARRASAAAAAVGDVRDLIGLGAPSLALALLWYCVSQSGCNGPRFNGTAKQSLGSDGGSLIFDGKEAVGACKVLRGSEFLFAVVSLGHYNSSNECLLFRAALNTP